MLNDGNNDNDVIREQQPLILKEMNDDKKKLSLLLLPRDFLILLKDLNVIDYPMISY